VKFSCPYNLCPIEFQSNSSTDIAHHLILIHDWTCFAEGV